MTVNLLDYSRQSVGSAVASDEKYTSTYAQSQGLCDLHTTPPVVEPEPPNVLIDPDDPSWSGNTIPPDLPDNPTPPELPLLPEEEPYIPA